MAENLEKNKDDWNEKLGLPTLAELLIKDLREDAANRILEEISEEEPFGGGNDLYDTGEDKMGYVA